MIGRWIGLLVTVRRENDGGWVIWGGSGVRDLELKDFYADICRQGCGGCGGACLIGGCCEGPECCGAGCCGVARSGEPGWRAGTGFDDGRSAACESRCAGA